MKGQNKAGVFFVKPEFIQHPFSAAEVFVQKRFSRMIAQSHLLNAVVDEFFHRLEISIKGRPGNAGFLDQLGDG